MLSSAEFHKDFLALRIATHEISVNGLDFMGEVSAQALTALVFEPKNPQFSWKALNPTTIQWHLERENDHAFKVHARMNISLSCPCVRCLDEVLFNGAFDFAIRMLEMEHLGITDTTTLGWDSDLDEDELADTTLVGYFHHQSIDLGLILREQIFLEVPDYPHCGINKNGLGGTGCKDLPLNVGENHQLHENPFIRLFGKKTK